MAPLLLLLLVFSTLPICIFLLRGSRSRRSSRNLPPGPKGLPFIGNIHQFDIMHLHTWLTKLSNKYGPLMYLKIGRVPLIVISSAEMARKALKENDVAFAGRPYTLLSLRISYDHNDIITSPYTEYWRKMRKMVVHHLFSLQKLRSYRPIRDHEVSSLIAVISNKANNDEAVDIGEVLSSYNSDVLCRIAFGKKLERSGEQSTGRLEKTSSQILGCAIETWLADCVIFGWVSKLLLVARGIEKPISELDAFYQRLIDEHLDPNRPDSMRNDIVDLLIQLREDPSAAVKIDSKHIKAMLMNIFLAGTFTTVTSIIWAMTCLVKSPDVMKKVQEEIRSVIGNKSSIYEDDIEMLPYLKAVVKESLRLYPPIPLTPKETTKACIIDGYEIEAKTFVLVNIWAIGRDPKYWENPDEFLPERFLNTSLDFIGQDFGFIPFGSGRRICVGIGLAVANAEVALANLLYFFNWEIPHGKTKEDIDTESISGLVLEKKNPLYLLPKTYI